MILLLQSEITSKLAIFSFRFHYIIVKNKRLYVDTVGKNAKKIQEYIQNQLKEDLEYDQMTLKEYIDPFTGEPVKQNKK